MGLKEIVFSNGRYIALGVMATGAMLALGYGGVALVSFSEHEEFNKIYEGL